MKRLISFKINKDLLLKFKTRCTSEGKTMTQVVTKLIEDYSCLSFVELYFVNKTNEKGTFLKLCRASEIMKHKEENVSLEVFKLKDGGVVSLTAEEVMEVTGGIYE